MAEPLPEQPERRAKVVAAVPILRRQKDLLSLAKGHTIAVRQLRWYSRTFEGRDEPTTFCDIGVVDLDAPDGPRVAGVVGISWTRVRQLLEASDASSWVVGKLIERDEGNFTAVELEPVEGLDLDKVAEQLDTLEIAALEARPEQLRLPAPELEADGPEPNQFLEQEQDDEEAEADDGIPF